MKSFSLAISIFLIITASAHAASSHTGIRHDSTGHHIKGSASGVSAATNYETTSSNFSTMYSDHAAQSPDSTPATPPVKQKNNYDKMMDAFKRNKFADTDKRVNKNAHADNYYDEKGILRDKDTGKIHRSKAAVKHFRANNPCPSTGKTDGYCPGYQVDHRIALKNGGADDPTNMRWLSDEEHQRKSATE